MTGSDTANTETKTSNYKKIKKMFPDIADKRLFFLRLETKRTATRFSLEWVNGKLFVHTNPAITVSINAHTGSAAAVIENTGRDGNGFLSEWLGNIEAQGYVRLSAGLYDAGDTCGSVFYDREQKPYCLLFRYGRDGTTVYNAMDRTEPTQNVPEGYMSRIAHIDLRRNIRYFEERDRLPREIVNAVENAKVRGGK